MNASEGESKIMELLQEKCVACQRDSPKVPEWNLTEESLVPQLQRSFRFPDFAQVLVFSNTVGNTAEAEGHHPRIVTEWGNVTIS